MAGSLGSLVVSLAADTARFQGDLGRAAQVAESRMRNIKDSATRALGAITIAATAAGTALTIAVKAAIDRADNMRDLAQGAGVTVEAMSRLAYAGKQAGVEVDLVAKALAKLAKDGAADPQQALEQIADRFAALPDGAEKTALAIEHFGERIGPQLVPLLNEGREGLRRLGEEADRLGITISTRAAAASDEFNDRLGMLRGTVDGLANNLAAEMLPALNAITSMLAESATNADNLDRASRQLATGFKLLIDIGYSVYKTFDDIGGALGALAAAAVAVAQGDFSRAAAIISEANADQIRSEQEANEFLRRLWSDRAEFAEQAAVRIARTRMEAITRGNDPIINRVRTVYDPKGDKPKKDGVDEALKRQADAYRDVLTAGQAAMDGLRTPAEAQIAQYHEMRFALEQLAATYPNLADQAQAALKRLEVDGLEDIKITARKILPPQEVNDLSVFAEQAARNMQSHFAEFFYSFDGGLKGMFASFADTIRRMAAELAAQELLRSFFAWGSGLGGGLGSFFGSLGKGLPGRASGGPVSGGRPYLVGERGAELFVPGSSGSIVPNHAMAGGLSITVAPVYHMDNRGATQELIKQLPAIMEQNKRETVALAVAAVRDNVKRRGRV